MLGAIANAIYDACGVRVTELPITPEKILRGLKDLELTETTSSTAGPRRESPAHEVLT